MVERKSNPPTERPTDAVFVKWLAERWGTPSVSAEETASLLALASPPPPRFKLKAATVAMACFLLVVLGGLWRWSPGSSHDVANREPALAEVVPDWNWSEEPAAWNDDAWVAWLENESSDLGLDSLLPPNAYAWALTLAPPSETLGR